MQQIKGPARSLDFTFAGDIVCLVSRRGFCRFLQDFVTVVVLYVRTVIATPSRSSCQILLKNSDLGTSVDETEGLIKRHEAFEKLLSTQEDKVWFPYCLWLFSLTSH